MPVYEYECAGCKSKFELRRAMTEEDTGVQCPKCGAGKPRRLFSVFGVSSGSGAQSAAAEQARCESCSSGGGST